MAERYRQYYTDSGASLHAAFPAEDVTFCIREALPRSRSGAI